jgi:hypothetical protein
LKLLKENIEKMPEDRSIGNYFLNRTPIAQDISARIDKQDCIKLTSFYISKETISRIKRQPKEWEQILSSYSSDKGLISRICKELKKVNTKKNKY